MSEPTKVLIKKPIILKKRLEVVTNVASQLSSPKPASDIREEIIYRIDHNDIFNGQYPNLLIVNRVNVSKQTLRTVASYTIENGIVQICSDKVTELIGCENYDLVLRALRSVDDEKLRIQSILGLLKIKRESANKVCQTRDTCMEMFLREKRRQNRPNRCKAYVIDDVHETNNTEIHIKSKVESRDVDTCNDLKSLTDLKPIIDEDSIISDVSNDGNLSMVSCQIPNILENPHWILNSIDNYTVTKPDTCGMVLKLVDGSSVVLRTKPKDLFHIACAEVLQGLSVEEKQRVLIHQAYIDWKYCRQPDEDGNLPIHIAVMNNDIDLLRRHCALLKNSSVDIIGGSGMSALQMSIVRRAPACSAHLLRCGADVLLCDERARGALHTASDTSADCVDVILQHCRQNARKILKDEDNLWRADYDTKSDDELAQTLLDHVCTTCDSDGYTPLMIAGMKGDHATVLSLLQASPRSVNTKMPTSGNTALYIVFQSAFTQAELSGNKKIIAQNYLEIIETMHKFGADPTIANDSGNSVTTLTTDFRINELSQAIANKLLAVASSSRSFDSYMLVKDSGGDINVELLTQKKRKEMPSKSVEETVEWEEISSWQRDGVSKRETVKKIVYFNVGEAVDRQTDNTADVSSVNINTKQFKHNLSTKSDRDTLSVVNDTASVLAQKLPVNIKVNKNKIISTASTNSCDKPRSAQKSNLKVKVLENVALGPVNKKIYLNKNSNFIVTNKHIIKSPISIVGKMPADGEPVVSNKVFLNKSIPIVSRSSLNINKHISNKNNMEVKKAGESVVPKPRLIKILKSNTKVLPISTLGNLPPTIANTDNVKVSDVSRFGGKSSIDNKNVDCINDTSNTGSSMNNTIKRSASDVLITSKKIKSKNL